MSHKNTFKIAHEHQEWLSSIENLRYDIRKLQDTLTQLAVGMEDDASLKQVEHFQNQVIIQRNHMDEVEHAIHLHIDRFEAEAKKEMQQPPISLKKEHKSIPESLKELSSTLVSLEKELKIFSKHSGK
ncbi:MAG: hypothetical protein FJX94_04345 [Bacteroidetes bacterium]|nr:hypothetical protein [Bacteroidota bacterium]